MIHSNTPSHIRPLICDKQTGTQEPKIYKRREKVKKKRKT